MVMMIGAIFFGPGAVGKAMFEAMVWPLWIFCLLEGIRNTTDCLSEEKREGTLGLLFLTDLRGYDVVLGKLAGAGLGALFIMLATFPLLGLSLLWGGVTAGEFWRMALALVNTLFFSLSTGMLVSAISREGRRAWLGSLAILVFFTVILGLIAAPFGNRWPGTLFGMGSPWTIFSNASDAAYKQASSAYWNGCVGVHLLAWIELGLASVLLPLLWQDREARLTRRRRRALKSNPAIQPPPGGADPKDLFAKLDSRRRLAWIPIVAVVLITTVVWLVLRTLPGLPLILWLCSAGVHVALLLWIAWEACHSFGDLRRSGMLELMLVTPLTVKEIIQGQDQALRRLFLGPLALLLTAEVVFFVLFSIDELAGGRQSNGVFSVVVGAVMLGGGIGLFLLDGLAVVRAGMWFGLTTRKHSQAWGKTVVWVEIIPLIVSVVLPTLVCFTFATPGLLLAKGLVVFSWANSKLHHELRSAVAGR